MENETLLSVRGVSSRYVSRPYGVFGRKIVKPVLFDINLEIRRGEILGLLGPSGCGKSTLGKCILGLIDYEGEIYIGGLDRRLEGRKRRGKLLMAKKVQAVFQNPGASLNPAKRIGTILEEPLLIHKTGTKAERLRRIDLMLSLVGLDPSYKKRRPHELSGGQKQRICIASALMLKPSLLVSDEAVSALDVSVAAQILGLFRELRENLEAAEGEPLTMLFISHSLNTVYYLCDRIAVMREGRIAESGDTEELYKNPRHPYTRALLKTAEPG
ncbi:MAG: ATP-binding cassette domain-containing protein [Treponema sp.]|jgi:ABC-type glutathione transport system ATPase component|nr:ATP-binding cassette domain-containing protein [Treponema sp.]